MRWRRSGFAALVVGLALGLFGVSGARTPASAAAGDIAIWKVYPPGWNLVAGPAGSRLALHGEALLALDGEQEAFAVNSRSLADAGQGYWVYYPQGAILLLIGAPKDISLVHVDAGHWATIGNSGSGPAAIRGANVALTYTPDAGFQSANVLQPGQAAFVYAAAESDVVLDPFSLPPPPGAAALPAVPPPSLPPTAGVATPTDELAYLQALSPLLSDINARLGDFADGIAIADPSRPTDPVWAALRTDASSAAQDLASLRALVAPPRYAAVQVELVQAFQDLSAGMNNTIQGLLGGQPERVTLGASELDAGASELDAARALLPM